MNSKTSRILRRFSVATKEPLKGIKRIYNRIPRNQRASFKHSLANEYLK